MHQHYFDLTPMYWFIHFRGVGAPLALTKAIKAALDVTAIPFPQKGPEKPSTPFDARRLAKILHGTATVGEEGVVTVDVSRKGRVVVDGVEVNTDANLSTNVQFKPHGKAKDAAVAGPDFSMTSSEVTPVISLMRGAGWQVDCLHNQETAESPQLYFSHMLKTGDNYELATEIRRGLDLTHADRADPRARVLRRPAPGARPTRRAALREVRPAAIAPTGRAGSDSVEPPGSRRSRPDLTQRPPVRSAARPPTPSPPSARDRLVPRLREHGYRASIWEIHRHVGIGGDAFIGALFGEMAENADGDDSATPTPWPTRI
jgi:hypothetical protein